MPGQGQDGKTVREERAMEVLASYRHMELEMRPISLYSQQ